VLGRGALLTAALAVCGSPAAALPVRVALDWPAGRPTFTLTRVHIQALQVVGPRAGGLSVEAEAGANGVVLDLGGGAWQLEAEAPGYWSQGAEVMVGRQAATSVRLALWPAGSLHGEVVTAGGEPLPRDLEVRLSAVPAPAGETGAARPRFPPPEPSPSRAELRCRIDEGRWSCVGPAGLFDVQFGAAGYAPRYAWDVRVEAVASTDLGGTVLGRTASVLGRAVRSDGSFPQGPCRATLRAEVRRRGSPEPIPESASEGGTNVSVPLSRRGYFHVIGVPSGGHVLVVECVAASAARDLRVEAGRETRIDPPLLLEELTLDIVVQPRVDPEGRPWQLTVEATAPRWRRIADRTTATADGRWTRRGLTAGGYRVDLKSSDGTQWLQRFFKLHAGSGPLWLRLRFVRVEGRVLLSGHPLRARLVFFNQAGGEPATLTSDDDGRFQGLLPVAPDDATETRWAVEVHAAQPPITRRLEGVIVRSVAGEASAPLELALPVFAVRGTVVSEGGEPQSGAQVTLEDAVGKARTVVATDDAGGFELFEMPPGSYTAVAESVEGSSDRTAFEVVEGVESELQLVLNRSERVAFNVVSSRGGPVTDAAVQVWVPPGAPRGFTRTDPDGRFELDLPPGTTGVGLTIGAPGHALKLTRLPASNEQTITLGASGGTLVLDLQRPGRAIDGPTTPYLVHAGAIEAAGMLPGWGSVNAGATGSGPVVVEAIEPGVYALCLVGPTELSALWRGALPSDRCRTGSLEEGRTLTLSPP
jgi:Carboxypeptidase regulatory-like domain